MEFTPCFNVLATNYPATEFPMSDPKYTKPSSTNRTTWKLGALCVACCTIPFVGVAIGSTALAAFSIYSKGAAIAIAVLGGAFLAYRYISRRKAPSCDIDCGCRPTSGKGEKIPDNPVTCNLPDINSRAQRKNINHLLLSRVQEIQDFKTGFRLRFEHNQANIIDLNQFIRAEQECCNFLVFEIEIESDKSSVWLAITGEQAKSFLKSEFGPYLRSESKKE